MKKSTRKRKKTEQQAVLFRKVVVVHWTLSSFCLPDLR